MSLPSVIHELSRVFDTPANARPVICVVGMNELAQQTEFLSWKIAPARLNATQTAWFLGFEPHEIPMLIAAGLLKPLGHPARNSTKYFATETLEQLRRDEKWLARASDAIASYWRERNARKQKAGERA